MTFDFGFISNGSTPRGNNFLLDGNTNNNEWLGGTPVIFSLVPARWRLLYALNPMVGVVDGFRWALLGTGEPPRITLAASALGALVVLTAGALFFRRVEKTFADVV